MQISRDGNLRVGTRCFEGQYHNSLFNLVFWTKEGKGLLDIHRLGQKI